MNVNPTSLDNKGSCWILKDFYCSVTILGELGLITVTCPLFHYLCFMLFIAESSFCMCIPVNIVSAMDHVAVLFFNVHNKLNIS